MNAQRFKLLVLASMLAGMQLASAGCATYQNTSLPGAATLEVSKESQLEVVEGAHVRVKLRSGETFEGTVSQLSEDQIVLGGLGNYGLTELVLAFGDIEMIGVRKQGDGQIERSWFGGLFFAAIIAIAVSLPLVVE